MKFFFALAFLCVTAADGAIITYTDRGSFLAALSGVNYQESFTSLGSGVLSTTSLNFSGSGFGYTISTSAPSLFGTTVSGDQSMSISSSANPLTVNNFTGGVLAIGGYFYFDDGKGALSTTGIGDLTAANGIDPNAAVAVGPASSLTNFVGFISTTPLTSLNFVKTSNTAGQFPNIDDLIVGAPAAAQGVPEPGSIALVFAGLAAMGAFGKRR